MQKRHFPRINITLPQQMVDELARHEKKMDISRSGIIQAALREWLAKQPREQTGPSLVAGQPYDRDKPYKDYLLPDMTGDKMLQTLQEYEAAAKRGR
jgi:hypothetical protein